MAEYHYIEGLQYPDEVLIAVRYGYQYRLDAELYCQDESIHFHHRLLDAPDLLNWFANLILSGVAWDVLKGIAVELKERFHREKRNIPPMAEQILTNQQDLRTFYEYIKEFQEGKLNISNREKEFIYEEIVADYSGKETARIYESEKRFPTKEESKRIMRDAHEAADMILSMKEKDHSDENESGRTDHLTEN